MGRIGHFPTILACYCNSLFLTISTTVMTIVATSISRVANQIRNTNDLIDTSLPVDSGLHSVNYTSLVWIAMLFTLS